MTDLYLSQLYKTDSTDFDEIETGSRGIKNIKKVLDSGYDLALSFSINGYIRGKIANELAKLNVDSDRVMLATPYDYERIIEKLSA